MTLFLDAALRVMSATRPMRAREITEEALRRGLLRTRGKTPEATLTAALYLEAKVERPRVRRIFTPGGTKVRWLLGDKHSAAVG
ncbi:MAG: hypothetical protein E6J14_09275 [Chloroflexi bacterium]|nr:MAG: hypothetical protein E6J14_09275 [Chloroflexota bacterium]